MNNERRYRYFCIDGDAMMCIMGDWKGAEHVRLPVIKGLPDGYRVVGVQFSFERDTFVFRVQHESFPVQDEDSQPPFERMDWEWVRIKPQNPTSNIQDRLRTVHSPH